MDPFEPPPTARRFIDANGEIYVWAVRPDLLIERGTGILTVAHARCIGEGVLPAFEAGIRGIRVFGDFERLTHYTREARELLSNYSLPHIEQLNAIHFLISSKFVALGLSAYKEDIGSERLRVYTDRQSFLRSFEAALGC